MEESLKCRAMRGSYQRQISRLNAAPQMGASYIGTWHLLTLASASKNQ